LGHYGAGSAFSGGNAVIAKNIGIALVPASKLSSFSVKTAKKEAFLY
jgi:hypothetical protein